MIGFALAAAVVAYSAIIVWLGSMAAIHDNIFAAMAAVILVAFGLGLLFQTDINADRKGPCITYEIKMVYDPALKIAREARVCTERGEWVE